MRNSVLKKVQTLISINENPDNVFNFNIFRLFDYYS